MEPTEGEEAAPKKFTDLPAEILLLIIANLETARDLRAVALSNRAFHSLVRGDGWRLFVKTRFPSLLVPNPAIGRHDWKQLADSLTWQSRCWDRRALQFQALVPSSTPTSQAQGRRYHGGNQRLFHSVVDAHFDPETQQELVVWGAGEDIIARHRERSSKGEASKSSWHRIDGKDFGFKVGHDDVNAIKIVKHQTGRAIISGRHNGKLSLLSAEPDRFGEHLSDFLLTNTCESQPEPQSLQTFDQSVYSVYSVNSVDVVHNANSTLIAAATKNSVLIYDLGEDEISPETAPSTLYDLQENTFTSETSRLSRAKWMDHGETIALALGGTPNPLRYLAITPDGWAHHTAAKNVDIAAQFELKDNGNLCPNSLEPVYRHAQSSGKTSLILSGWRDGTCR